MTCPVPYVVAVNISHFSRIVQEMLGSIRWCRARNERRKIIHTVQQTAGPCRNSRLCIGSEHVSSNHLAELHSAKCNKKDDECKQQNSPAICRKNLRGAIRHYDSRPREERRMGLIEW